MADLEHLSDKDVEAISGGTIVEFDNGDGKTAYVLVRDEDGQYYRICDTLDQAQSLTARFGESRRLITYDEYKSEYNTTHFIGL